MNYYIIENAVNYILSEAHDDQNECGWVAPKAPQRRSRTVTAQVILTLSKCAEKDSQKEKILEIINRSFTFLKNSTKGGGAEVTTYAFTLLAHIEHHQNFPDEYALDNELINDCLTGIIDKDFWNGKRFTYDYHGNAEFFGTYAALRALLKLDEIAYKNSYITLPTVDLEEIILKAFEFIKKYYEDNINTSNEFDEVATLYTLGLEVSYSYQRYIMRNKGIAIPPFCFDQCIEYFLANYNETILKRWHVVITDSFELLYVSNLISGLLNYRDQLKENGILLLYKISEFIVCNENIQEKNGEGILKTILLRGVKKDTPVWATAHSLNAILKMDWSIKELKVSNNNIAHIRKSNKLVNTTSVLAILSGVLGAFFVQRSLYDSILTAIKEPIQAGVVIIAISLVASVVLFYSPRLLLSALNKIFPNNNINLIANITFAILSLLLFLIPENGTKILAWIMYTAGSLYYINHTIKSQNKLAIYKNGKIASNSETRHD